MAEIIKVRDIEIGRGKQLLLISGPCVIESSETTKLIARRLKEITCNLGIPFIFKASYDKANRTDIGGYRGPGLKKGLEILSEIREELDIPVTSDVHSIEEVPLAAETLDLLQVPALLFKQLDFVMALGRSKKPVNIKKGPFAAAWEVNNILKNLKLEGLNQVMVTERGNFFGYQTMVTDFRNIQILKSYGVPVAFDASHSQQLPIGIDKAMEKYSTRFSGPRQFIPALAKAGIVTGADALFLESHIDPDNASSDGATSFKIENMEELLTELIDIKRVICGK